MREFRCVEFGLKSPNAGRERGDGVGVSGERQREGGGGGRWE